MKFRFQFRRYRLPLRAPVRTAHGVWTEREGIVVRLEDEDRRTGLGEAAPIPGFGTETVDEAEAGARALGEWTTEDAMAALPARLGCLRNAVAAACSEVGQVSDLPSTETTVASAKGRVEDPPYLPIAALLPAGKAALALIPPKAEMGFRVFKWKVGVGDVADELALLDDVCAALPSGAKLRLDANGAWDRRRAERWLERCAERPVEFVEQPIAADARGAMDLLMGLAGDFPTPLALDESLIGEGDVERWIGAGWPGVYVVKPSLLGDVGGVTARLEKAKAAVVFSSALETAVGARAALRAAFAWKGERRAAGFGVWPLFADARFDGPTAMPFVRREDVEHIEAEAVWNALS
jgi:O-succinylbenzoate synthase